MKCPRCHFENPDDTRFCGHCGTQIKPSDDISASHTETFETPVKELTRGSTLAGRYEIIEELGRGGMGNVYRVVDKKINEEMALKLLNPAIAADAKTIERFRNELKFSRKVTHKNVCRMYDLNEEEGTLYITMEYVPGEDLKSMIRMTGQISLSRAISIAKQICEGLIEAHRLGVVHRDLKPRNIMIDKEGNAKIMDFGVARSLKMKGITKAGAMIGTPEYMSPEQVEGKEADQRSDIYSLGVIIFEMVTGRIPFGGDTSLSIALKHKTEIPPDPRQFNTQIPEDLSRVILRCMEKDKEKRYQRAEELLSEISQIEEEISTEERVLPKKKTRVETMRKRIQPFRVAALLLFFIIVGALGYLFLARFLKEKAETGIPAKMKWKNSIAILPFQDISLQKDQEPLCEAMTDGITTKLASIAELKVIPYYSVRQYKNKDKSPKEIGKELNVEAILAPTLQKLGNKIHVSSQLIDVNSGCAIGSYEEDSDFEDILAVQDKISKEIATRLKVDLAEERLKDIKKREPKSAEANRYYIKARYFERKFWDFEEQRDFEAAVDNFEKAIKVDESYALAYWALGNTYQAKFVKDDKWKDFDLMENNYMKAYQIDKNLAEANVGLGWARFYKNDSDEAYGFNKKALELDPNNPEINRHVGSFLRDIGLYHKAIEFYSRAIEVDPVSTTYRDDCARCYMFIGEFKKAANLLLEALELEPDDIELHLLHARQLIMMKKYDEAEKEIAKTEKLDPDNPDIQHIRSYIYAVKGEKEKALGIIKDLDPYYHTHLISTIYSILGMKDKAIENIQEVIEKGFYEVKTYAYSYLILIKNPFYDSLRDDPRFKEIVRKEKKKYKEKLKKYGNL